MQQFSENAEKLSKNIMLAVNHLPTMGDTPKLGAMSPSGGDVTKTEHHIKIQPRMFFVIEIKLFSKRRKRLVSSMSGYMNPLHGIYQDIDR